MERTLTTSMAFTLQGGSTARLCAPSPPTPPQERASGERAMGTRSGGAVGVPKTRYRAGGKPVQTPSSCFCHTGKGGIGKCCSLISGLRAQRCNKTSNKLFRVLISQSSGMLGAVFWRFEGFFIVLGKTA